MTSLRGMLIAWVLLPVAMVLTLPVVLIFSSVESMLEARLEKEIELVARSLRLPVEGALRSGDRQRLHEALGAVAEIGQVYGAAVYDAAGRRIAVAGEAIPGPAEQLQAVELVAIGEQVGLYDDFAGKAVYSYFVPLSTSLGRIDALLQVVREESEIRSRLDLMRRTGIAVALTGLALIFGVVMIGHRMALTRPVQRLLEDMRNIGRGERSRRAGIGPPKELAQVAGGLNQMLDALDQAEDEVHQRQQREAKLREEMRRQESQAALGRFSAGVAHELGAPLTVIQTDVQRLRDACAGDAKAGRRLDRITDQLRRTRQLVGQLMSLVRDPEVEPAPSDLNEIVQRAVQGAWPQAESRNVQLAFAPTATVIVPALPIRVEHAVLNLLRNAVQAADSRVEVSVDHDDDCGTVTVEDDGPGMEVEQSSKVFEPFHTGRKEGEGTGLGLTIVRAVAELHGGSVRVGTSRHLGGCSFELRLPRGGPT